VKIEADKTVKFWKTELDERVAEPKWTTGLYRNTGQVPLLSAMSRDILQRLAKVKWLSKIIGNCSGLELFVRQDGAFPKLDVVGSNPIARFERTPVEGSA
jgi:hypothetical protein